MRLLARWCAAVLLLAGLLFSAALGQSAMAQTPESLYQSALASYRALEYGPAHERLLQALELSAERSDAQRALVCKALGNVAFRQEHPLEAAAWFSAAIELVPRDGEAWSNLELARSKAGLSPADRGDLMATLQRVLHALSLAEAEWLALLVALGLGLGVVLRALVFGRAATRWLGVAAVLGAFALLPWLVRLCEARYDPVFVVSSSGGTLLSEPRAAATKLDLLPAGSRALRQESVAGWTRVRTEEGKQGWVSDESVFALRR
jgi:tetratricopeptide (TPR) repeat protein